MHVIKGDKSAQINDSQGNFIALIEQAPDHPYSYWVETNLVPTPCESEVCYTYHFTTTSLDDAIKHTVYLIQVELEGFIEDLKLLEQSLDKK